VVLAAVSVAGFAIRFASTELKGNRNVLWAALKNAAGIKASAILAHSSPKLKSDREIVCYAIERDSKALLLASEELQVDHGVVKIAWESVTEDHDSDLWHEFDSSTTKEIYAKNILFLRKESRERKSWNICLRETGCNVAFADAWITELLRSLWLVSKLVKKMNLPIEMNGYISDYTGLKEDLQIAKKLKSFGTVMDQWSMGLADNFAAEVWDEFLQKVEEIMQKS